MLKVNNSSSLYELCRETTQLFHITRPSFPISQLTTTIAFDTTQPSSIRAYFAAIFFTPTPNSSITTDSDDAILLYKGTHNQTAEEAISGLLAHLRTEVGAKVRETVARRKPGISRENWKGYHDLSAAVRRERADSVGAVGSGVTYQGSSEAAETSGAIESGAERLRLEDLGRPPSYGA